MDVKKVFFNGDPNDEICMEQPKDCEVLGKMSLVCKLKKSLDAFKDSPCKWYKHSMLLWGPKEQWTLISIYEEISRWLYVILILYVDYILITDKNKDQLSKLKKILSWKFCETQNTSLACVVML